jgi:hypothetical protein
MKIERPLPGPGGTLVEITPDTQGTVLDPQMTTGYIDLPMPVLSWSRRVLLFGDGEPLMLDPSGYEPDCRQVAVPAMPVFNVIRGYAALDSITYRADNLVRACETQDPLVIQRSVTKYHNEIAARLSGKHGLLNRRIYGVRCEYSMRFVITPGRDLAADEVGLPEVAARAAGIMPRDIVLLTRSPILWQGSVLAMRVVYIPGYAGRLNPWCMRDLGADHDGDECSVILWPDSVPEPETLGPETPCLPPEIVHDIEWRGLSLSASDMLAGTGFVAAAEAVPDDLQEYAKGMCVNDYLAAEEKIILSVAAMKIQLGVVGSVTDKICFLVRDSLLPAALRAKEKVSQALLDSKHGVDHVDVEDMSRVFESGSAAEVLDLLVRTGVPETDAQAIAQDLADKGVPPLTSTFRDLRPEIAVAKGTAKRLDLLRTIETVRDWGGTVLEARAIEQLA